MKIAITADSVIDINESIKKEYDIKVLPLRVLLGDKEYNDGEITPTEVFNFVKENKVLPKTSAVSTAVIESFFESTLKDYDYVIYFSISSSMSSVCSNAVEASEKFGGKVKVIDSKALSTGMALLAIYARNLTKTDLSFDEIVKKVEERVDKVQTSFVLESLDYMKKGGRCSSIALLGANLLKIRPQIITKDGKLISAKKYRGAMPMVISKYCQDVFAENPNPDKSVIFITYSSATDEMIKSAYDVVNKMGFEKIYETSAGCTVCSHCGENTLGILFINN